MSDVRPPHRTACSPNRSLSVSSLKVVSKTPARAEEMPGALGGNHDNVDIIRRLNGFEVDTETVGDAEHFAGMQIRPDGGLVQFALGLVGREDVDPVGALGCL